MLYFEFINYQPPKKKRPLQVLLLDLIQVQYLYIFLYNAIQVLLSNLTISNFDYIKHSFLKHQTLLADYPPFSVMIIYAYSLE